MLLKRFLWAFISVLKGLSLHQLRVRSQYLICTLHLWSKKRALRGFGNKKKEKRWKKRKKENFFWVKAGLICVDKLQATKVVITEVYTPISDRDKLWGPFFLVFKVRLQPIAFIHTYNPQPFGIWNILWSFCKHICPSPLRAPDHTAARATGFICDHRQFVTALSLSLRGFLQNILIIPCKISILMILLWTEIRSCRGWCSFAEFKPRAHGPLQTCTF